jgi:hypothetical protein
VLHLGTIREKVEEGINVTTLTFLLPTKQETRTVKEVLKKFA